MLSPSPRPQRTLLIVDDEADLRGLLSDSLQSQGFDVDQASDGIDALSYLYATMPTAVLIDLLMPRMNGVEVIRQIRSDRNLGGISIVAMSGEKDMLARAKEAGADAVLRKPFDLAALLRTVRAQIGRAREPEATPAHAPERRRRRVA